MSLAPPPGRLPPGTRRIALPRAALFQADGAGSPLLCIPGGYHGAWCFADWMRRLGDAGRAAAVLEPRGKGTLEAAADPATTIEDYAEDTAAAAEALGGAPVLLGHSLGALVAMRAALRLPRVAGLVLVAPSPPGNMPGVAGVPVVAEGRMVAPPAPEVVAARYLGGERPEGFAAYHAALSPESPQVLNDRYALRVAVDPARLAGVPVLVIEAGRDDAQRHPAGQDAAIAGFLGGAHVLLADMPHCMMVGRWAGAALDPVLAWLRTR